jgi:genome maintenance exonuclease 1|tara:strand:- start:3778 stop:4482 length:705 start_codon:yes stop_codon:yes gene_type:complete
MKISKDILLERGISYVQKYQYKDIGRVSKNGKRHYETPDGRQVPSVTTVLSATKDMTHLHAWRKRIGEQKAQQITTESANIGTVMHRSLEKHVKGQDRTPGSNLIQQKAHKMANVIIDNGLKNVSEVWGSEVSLYYPELYAGTTDLVGTFKGAPAIMDFKQARKLKKKEWVEDYFLQLVAYAEAHNKMFDTNIKHGQIFICTQNNEYQTFEIDNYDKWVGQWYTKLEEYYKKFI